MNHFLSAGVALVAVFICVNPLVAQQKPLPQQNDSYYLAGQAQLSRALGRQPNTNRAKNIILIVGDGMGISTVTAGRIFEGQQRGADGESNVLAFEAFPFVALTKTYAHNAQVADSAPTASAMMTGIKTNNDMINVTGATRFENCDDAKTNGVATLAELAERAGMSTGVVTTARITHATPAAVYAHVPARDWESDSSMPAAAIAAGCKDIARQLVEWPYGNGLEVALGGGREMFMPFTQADPESPGAKSPCVDTAMQAGGRRDGRDLIKAWRNRYRTGGAYVWNKQQFDAIDPQKTTHLLGLFERCHARFEADRASDKAGEPSLAEMAGKAIDILQTNSEGFFLMVEAGRIDHASHDGNAYRALADVVALNDTVKLILSKVSTDETLIIVTGDHSHSLTINGYPKRGNPILGLAVDVNGATMLGDDRKPYTTLSYANGPGASTQARADLSKVDTQDPDFLQQALVPLPDETHTGEDLGTYAIGPFAHLFQGTVEQNFLFHVMDHSARISARAARAP